jgi:hypothetical protein
MTKLRTKPQQLLRRMCRSKQLQNPLKVWRGNVFAMFKMSVVE